MRPRAVAVWALSGCVVLAACGSTTGQSSPTAVVTGTPSTGDAAVSASPFPSLPPTSSPTTLADVPWWRMAVPTITVGLGDGTITGQLRIGEPRGDGLGPAFARGPFGGRVVAASLHGPMTELSIIDVPTGRATVAASQPDILDATLDPTGTVAYWVTGGGDADAVWRLSLVDGTQSRLFSFPTAEASAGTIGLAAYVEVTAQLALSTDGGHLAAMRCRAEGCQLGVLDLVAGGVSWYEAGSLGQVLFGFAEDGISLGWQCVTLPGGALVDSCGALDSRAAAAEMARNLTGSAELPAGWHLEVRPVPDAPPMSFQQEVVAVPDAGGKAVPFAPLEVVGQG